MSSSHLPEDTALILSEDEELVRYEEQLPNSY